MKYPAPKSPTSAIYGGISSPSELNRILPPIEIVSNTSSSNIIYDSRQPKASPLSPISPNGQRFGYSKMANSSRISGGSARKIHHSQNGSTIGSASAASDSNTIRIKVNQAMKWSGWILEKLTKSPAAASMERSEDYWICSDERWVKRKRENKQKKSEESSERIDWSIFMTRMELVRQ